MHALQGVAQLHYNITSRLTIFELIITCQRAFMITDKCFNRRQFLSHQKRFSVSPPARAVFCSWQLIWKYCDEKVVTAEAAAAVVCKVRWSSAVVKSLVNTGTATISDYAAVICLMMVHPDRQKPFPPAVGNVGKRYKGSGKEIVSNCWWSKVYRRLCLSAKNIRPERFV